MDLNQTNIYHWNENAFSCAYTSTHLIREPHSILYNDLLRSWSAGFGGCHDVDNDDDNDEGDDDDDDDYDNNDDDDDDFYDDLLRSWSAGSGGCQWCRPFSTLSSLPLGPDPFPG